jgi:hypothetical protein
MRNHHRPTYIIALKGGMLFTPPSAVYGENCRAARTFPKENGERRCSADADTPRSLPALLWELVTVLVIYAVSIATLVDKPLRAAVVFFLRAVDGTPIPTIRVRKELGAVRGLFRPCVLVEGIDLRGRVIDHPY